MSKTIYLAGPHQDDDYRSRAKYLLEHAGFVTIDPLRPERDFRGREDDCVDEIVEGDLDDVAKVNGILANFSRNSVGTSMETWYGHWSHAIPVFPFVTGGNRISPWVTYVAFDRKVYSDVEDAIDSLILELA